MKKKWKWILAALAVVFGLLQFTNPAHTNPPVAQDLMATNPPPPEIAALLHAACYDCHSNETKWPWYSHVAPVSWLIADDVEDGRQHVNFSDWPFNNPSRAARWLENMSDELGYDEMPPAQYQWMHPLAQLTAAQRQQLIQWADQEAKRLKAAAATGK